jgi:coproporphyrinogen III oxidase-like Fe-S oxidoreductase
MLAGGSEVVAGRELLDDAAVSLEELYLGLRTTDGIMAEALPPLVRTRWQAEGWASMDGERLRLTAEGWLRLDALVSSVASSERANSRAELTLPG